MDGTLMLPGKVNESINVISIAWFFERVEVSFVVWNVATGAYHCLLVYALNKYGMDIWFRICTRSEYTSWWMNLFMDQGEVACSADVERKLLQDKLESLAEKGWGSDLASAHTQNVEVGRTTVAPVHTPAIAAASDIRNFGLQRNEGEDEVDYSGLNSNAICHSISCALVITFQCVLSDHQIERWVEIMRKYFGSIPRVERFDQSTTLGTLSWTHEALLHDAASLLRQAYVDDPQCTLQLGSWCVFLCETGEKVKMVKLQGLQLPVITSACYLSSVDMLEIKGFNLDGADLIRQLQDQSLRLLSKSIASKDSEELETLSVQCEEDSVQQDLHVYASRLIVVDGHRIYVRSEPAKISPVDDDILSTESTAWIMVALIMAVPVTQIALSLLYSSFGCARAILVGQVLGWMLAWSTLQLLAGRKISIQGKVLKPMELKNFFVDAANVRRGGLVLLFALLIISTHWIWTHMGTFQKKWLLMGTMTSMLVVAIFKLLSKMWRKKQDEVVSHNQVWMNLMSTAITYGEWAHAASMLHSDNSLDEAQHYDEAYVQGKLRELQLRRLEGTIEEVLFSLRADLFRHLGDMCNPHLHRYRHELPAVIRDYIKEVSNHIQAVYEMDVEEFSLEEKLTFMTETRQRVGRTALVFSGHVALGTFHSSVFRTLVEHQLLPTVIIGANLGAIVASIATTRTSSELQHIFDDPSLPMDFYEKLSTVHVAAYRLRTHDAKSYEIEKLQNSMQELLGDLTFEEAFDLSGRILGISLPACPISHQSAQFLNYLVSPHVVIWSAVAVSCVPPAGLLHRPELMIKDRHDRIVPYIPPTKVTSLEAKNETSLETQIAFQQVRELFNVNHFIVSQASPLIAPWLHFKESTEERSPLVSKFINLMEMELRHRCVQILDMGITLRGLTSVCAQKWEGDINIVLPITFSQVISMSSIQNDDPSPDDLRKAAMAGRRCTWAKLSAIQASCGVEFKLDEYINELQRRERHALHTEEDYRLLNDLASPRGIRQSEVDIGSSRPNLSRTQSSQGDADLCTNDELPLDLHRTPGYDTPSEVGTEDYLLDHLCSCMKNNPESLTHRCDAPPIVIDERIHVIEGGSDTIENHRPVSLVGETWPADEAISRDSNAQCGEEQDGNSSGEPKSICKQLELHNRDLQLEWDIGRDDVGHHSFGSPTTVLEGPGCGRRIKGRSFLQQRAPLHPGCQLERYFEEMAASVSDDDERPVEL